MDHPAAYVRAMITTRHTGRHRRWFRRTEVLVANHDTDLSDRNHLDDPSITIADRAQLEDVLRRLPARQRAALVLRVYCDLPYTEVGRELDITPAGARTLVFRALAALRADQPRPAQPLKDLR